MGLHLFSGTRPARLLRDSLGAALVLGLAGVPPPVPSPRSSRACGKWQLKNPEMEAALKQFQQQLASMPPAQRAQFEKMMADKGGAMSAHGKVKVCHNADTLKRGLMKDEPGCTTRTQWQTAGGTFESPRERPQGQG